MADNFLERQYEDYLAAKAAREEAKKAAWRRQLRAYQLKLQQQKEQQPEHRQPGEPLQEQQ